MLQMWRTNLLRDHLIGDLPADVGEDVETVEEGVGVSVVAEIAAPEEVEDASNVARRDIFLGSAPKAEEISVSTVKRRVIFPENAHSLEVVEEDEEELEEASVEDMGEEGAVEVVSSVAKKDTSLGNVPKEAETSVSTVKKKVIFPESVLREDVEVDGDEVVVEVVGEEGAAADQALTAKIRKLPLEMNNFALHTENNI